LRALSLLVGPPSPSPLHPSTHTLTQHAHLQAVEFADQYGLLLIVVTAQLVDLLQPV
jgi:hypothetical protein